jgi:hypothetical protein
VATTKALELGQFGSKVNVHNENITLDGNVHGQYAGFDSDFDIAIAGKTTSNLAEGSNLYYTDARTDARVALVVDSAPSALNTLNELAAALGDDASFSTTVTNSIATKLPLAGGAITGNVTFGDNNKAIFGAGSDLEIYHDGSNSYITDNGTGNLRLKATSLRVQSASGNTYLNATNGGSVDIFHNNTQKLATTSTGIDVTGGVNYTSGTLNYTGTSVPTGANNQGLYVPSYAIGLGGTYASLNFPTTSSALTTTAWWMLGRAGGSNDQFTLRVRRGGTAAADQTAYVVTTSGADSAKIVDSHKWYTGGSNGTERMRIASSGNVGIGDLGNAATLLHIGSTGTPELRVQDLDAGGGYLSITHNAGTSTISADPSNSSGSPTLVFNTVNTERMRINSSGNVLVGGTTSAGYSPLQAGSTSASETIIQMLAATNGHNTIHFGDATAGSGRYAGYFQYDHTNDRLNTGVNGSTRMSIDSSGNVGIGTSSPGDANEGAGLRVHKYVDRVQYYSPAGSYAGSFGYTNNTNTKTWLSVDSSYNQTSSVSAGLFLSPFHSDANGSFAGHTIKSIRDGGALLFSRVNTATSTGTAATESEFMRINGSGNVGIGSVGSAAPDPTSKLTIFGDGITLRLDGSGNTTKTMLFRNVSTANPAQIYADGSLMLRTEDPNTSIKYMPQDNANLEIIHDENGFWPAVDNQLNLGYTDKGWKNIFTNDLNLSNMNSPECNEVDGTNGKWTIQEGDEDLFIINRLNGKKYKFKLEEMT